MLPSRYLVDFSLSSLPRRVADYVIVGTGIAGLYTALKAAPHGRVILITKGPLEESSTEYAQGGIAAAVGEEDSPALHMRDTLEAGDGLSDVPAVQVMVNEGPDCVMELVALGTEFDHVDGHLALTREGAHRAPRVLHARGDATGDEIRRALSNHVTQTPGIEILEHTFMIDVLTHDRECLGVLVRDADGKLQAVLARATVLATGGAGQLYMHTTNPLVATGDGMAAAYRAGATLRDLEFVQFHPTVLWHSASPRFLISEAVRGEGAILRNSRGERFMPRYHPLADLAPRDVVARAIVHQMREHHSQCVYLDARSLCHGSMSSRFPGITSTLRKLGYDPEKELIPVSPAAHYCMGGIRTDLWGRTGLRRLYACGEVACVGVHGANRLASNSLLEGLVFGRRIAAVLRKEPPLSPGPWDLVHRADRRPAGDPATIRGQLQQIMWECAGIVRCEEGLREALREIAALSRQLGGQLDNAYQWEVANLLQLGALVVRAALLRKESRGAHFRSDHPEKCDHHWRVHLAFRGGCAPLREPVLVEG